MIEPNIVALIPAFNEEGKIAEVIRETQKFAKTVIVCDDGSTDSTYQISRNSGAEVLHHRENQGYGATLTTLFLKAGSINADAFVTVDSDGQHDSSYIPRIVQPILSGEADLVIGSRFLSSSLGFTPPHRRLAIKLITWLFEPRRKHKFTDLQSGFRAYNHKALRVTCPVRPGMGASTEIVKRAIRSGLKIMETPVPIYYVGEQPSMSEAIIQFVDVFRSTLASGRMNPRALDQNSHRGKN